MKLYFYGHEHVSQPCYPRVESAEGLSLISGQMIAMMKRHGLRGLAAPQVGILKQLVMVKLESGAFLELINPTVTGMYGSEFEMPESCISCPPRDNGCKVARIQIIEVKASVVTNLSEVMFLRFKGEDARIIQHEVDHLDGTFFFHRASIKDKTNVIQRFNTWKHQWKLTNEKENHGNDSSNSTKAKDPKTNNVPT